MNILDFIPENIMTLIVTSIILTVVTRITNFIIKTLLIVLLIGFLIYMISNYGPELMHFAPAPMRLI